MALVSFGDALAARRRSLFCNRREELAELDRFATQTPPRVLYVYGPGGVGKTQLLEHWIDQQALNRSRVRWLDAGDVSCTRAALASAFEALRREAGGYDWLVVDDYHHWEALEVYVRETLFGSLPEGLHVVLAGRHRPDAAWLTDAGWRSVSDLLRLDPLPSQDALTLLESLEVPAAQRAALARLCGGNPLGLCLGAALLREDTQQAAMCDETIGENAETEGHAMAAIKPATLRLFVSELLPRIGPDAHTNAQREAMECCALAGAVDEAVLRRVLDEPDDNGTAGWLRRLSMMEATSYGLELHDLPRRLMVLKNHFESPHRLLEMAGACAGEDLRRVTGIDEHRWDEAVPIVERAADTIALAHNPMRAANSHLNPPYQIMRADAGVMAPFMNGGSRPARFAAWLDKRARRRLVLVDEDDPHQVQAGLFCLSLAPSQDMQKVTNAFGIQTGDAMPDFLAAVPLPEATDWPPALARTVLLCALARHLCKPDAAGTLLLFPSRSNLQERLKANNLQVLKAHQSNLCGWRGLWLAPWRNANVEQALRLLYRLHGQRQAAGPAESEATTAEETEPLDATVFKQAVAQAFRHYTDARYLNHNPLIASAQVRALAAQANGDGTVREAVSALREVLQTAVEGLGNTPLSQKYRQVMEVAYISPRRQKIAAAELNMAYSTFRRHLHDAREMVAEEMWQQELRARR